MGDAKHTPGPWIAEQRSWGYPRYEGGPVIRAWDVRSAGGVPIAGGTIADANEANAHLIAAAPDLLASLQEIVREWGFPNTPKWHRARAAIAKAEGR